jgi:hypothetical protein
MDDLSIIENLLNIIDFSQGREQVVWEKILARLPRDLDAPSFDEFDKVGGGLSQFIDHGNNSEDI